MLHQFRRPGAPGARKPSHPARTWLRGLSRLVALAVLAYIAASGFRVYVRKYYVFLPSYVRWTFSTPASFSGPTDVFLLFVDHFEPDRDPIKTRKWAVRYMALAARHRDADGRPPQHTWFYPGEQSEPAIMKTLRELTTAGLGEVELHYHHSFDTAGMLRPRLIEAIHEFQEFGFLRTIDGKTHFAFIHGNFGLDNSNGPLLCGVNEELKLLRELGCYGDYSFPSVYENAQPSVVNTIYAARDDKRPKSYDTPLPLSALSAGQADLMMFEGPLIFAPTLNPRRLFLDLDDGDIHPAMPASPARVDRWIRAAVHVPQRPDWIFIKLFTHGISSPEYADAVLGDGFDQTLSYLEHEYNDGRRYRLHYITAREAYNLAMAASRGVKGGPLPYLNGIIPPYVANGSAEPDLASAGRPN